MENCYSLKLTVQPQNEMFLKEFLSHPKKQKVHGGNEQRVKRFQAAEPVLALWESLSQEASCKAYELTSWKKMW